MKRRAEVGARDVDSHLRGTIALLRSAIALLRCAEPARSTKLSLRRRSAELSLRCAELALRRLLTVGSAARRRSIVPALTVALLLRWLLTVGSLLLLLRCAELTCGRVRGVSKELEVSNSS